MVKDFLAEGRAVLFRRQTNIISAAFVISLTIAASAILGLLRDRLLASTFGASAVLDIFWAAFRLPDMIFQLLVMGALSAAFIPVFTGFLANNQKDDAFYVANSVINIGLVLILIFSGIVFIFSERFAFLLGPKLSAENVRLLASLTRILLASQFFFVFGNFLTGMLQSAKHFLVPGLAPVVYNLGIILGIIFLSKPWGIYGPAAGVVLGTGLFFLIQWPASRHIGWRWRPVFDFRHPGTREIGRLMFPRTMALAVSQIDLTVEVFLALLLRPGSLAILNLAQHLVFLPVRLFGVSIGQAALPTLSEEAGSPREGSGEAGSPLGKETFRATFFSCFHQILYLTIPASALLLVLRIPIVRLAYGAGQFNWPATVETGRALALISLSIFAQGLTHLLVRSFYAFRDTKTPFFVSAGAVLLNITLSILLTQIFRFGVIGLAFSMSVSNIFSIIALLFLLDKKISAILTKKLIKPALKIFLAGSLTAVALYLPMKLLDKLVFDTTRTINLIFLTGITSFVGLSIYFFLTFFLKVEEAGIFWRVFGRMAGWKKVLSETPEVIEGTR